MTMNIKLNVTCNILIWHSNTLGSFGRQLVTLPQGRAWPPTGYQCLNKGSTKGPLTVFRVSVKTTLFTVLSEKLPLFTAFYPEQWVLFPLRPEKPTLFYKICILPTLNDDTALRTASLCKKYPFSLFFVQALVPSCQVASTLRKDTS